MDASTVNIMSFLSKLFPFGKTSTAKPCMAIIGMVHVGALPGTPGHHQSVEQLVDQACHQTSLYAKHGLHGICIENMFDTPYVTRKDAGPEIVATMTRVASEVRKLCPQSMVCGVQVLAGLNEEAVAIAHACQLQFVRCEAFVFGHVADEGWMDGCAGRLLRYRRLIEADHSVALLTDIKKKHCSHSITADVDLVQTAKAALFFNSDGLVVTGQETGHAPSPSDFEQLRNGLPHGTPLVLGSGLDVNNLKSFVEEGVDAAIVGSHFKQDGYWANDLCETRLAKFMEEHRKLI